MICFLGGRGGQKSRYCNPPRPAHGLIQLKLGKNIRAIKMEKPSLTVVDASPLNPLSPPACLGAAGRKLWEAIMSDYVIEDSGGHAMLLQICAAVDSLEDYDQQITRDGPTIRSKTGIREHPLLKHQLAARSFIVRSLHRLGLDIESTRSTVGRPPGAFKKAR